MKNHVIRNRLLEFPEIITLNKSREHTDRETGEIKTRTIEHLTFNPKMNLNGFIKDAKINVFDNGGLVPHRFEIMFKLNRKLYGAENDYIDLLDHCLTCKMGSSNGNKLYSKTNRKNTNEYDAEWHDGVQADFVDYSNEAFGKSSNKTLPYGSAKRVRIWYGLSKTATSHGLKVAPYTSAYWVGDGSNEFSGELIVLIGENVFRFIIKPNLTNQHVNQNNKRTSRKFVASGVLAEQI